MCREKGLAAHVDGIECAEQFVRSAKFIGNGGLQDHDCLDRVVLIESDACRIRKIAEVRNRILRISLSRSSTSGDV